jgi:hypothetical protein
MTTTGCKCCHHIRLLKIWAGLSLALIMALGLTMWHMAATVAHADSIPDQITTKRLVIVDNAGNEVVTLGQHPDPHEPSTQLLFTSPDKQATYSLQVGTATNPNEGSFVFVDATRNIASQGSFRSEVSQYTLRVTNGAAASASSFTVYPNTGTGVQHISNVLANSSQTGMLNCSNGLLPSTCHLNQ